jgi:hypothetical protein
MTLDEEDELANHDAVVAAVAELMTFMATSEGILVEREVEDVDFV